MLDEEVDLAPVRPQKAYKNMDFINSRQARTIRVICEFEETLSRLREQGVKETIMFFGSARARTTKQHEAAVKAATVKLESSESAEDKEAATAALQRLEASKWMCGIVETTTELARKLTEWAMEYRSTAVVGGGFLARDEEEANTLCGASSNAWATDTKKTGQSLMICTGGGPGLMEAANRGAAMVEGSKNIGMGISLPFEAGLNPYVTPELGFEYHYFFTRKYWMLFPCRALVVAPGGFGTMDELFELLNLKKTRKIKADIPIVLLGKKYWESILNLEVAVKRGIISKESIESLLYTDSVDEAFVFVTEAVLRLRNQEVVVETK